MVEYIVYLVALVAILAVTAYAIIVDAYADTPVNTNDIEMRKQSDSLKRQVELSEMERYDRISGADKEK